MIRNHGFILGVLAVLAIVLSQSAFIVEQTEQALVLQFGNPVARYTAPGLKWKVPLIQQVEFFENRVLDVDPPAEEVILTDQKRLVVDTFARYRITDMLAFYTALSSEQQAATLVSNIINSITRSTLGNATLTDLLSEKRDTLMTQIKDQTNKAVSHMGIEIVDVRIVHADLPTQTIKSVYARMRTERQREAAEFRAQGQEQAQTIKSDADKQRTVIEADADKQAQTLKGEGDQQAIKIYADAYARDPEFYSFYRSMEAYKQSLSGDNVTLVLSPDGDFFRYLKDAKGKK